MARRTPLRPARPEHPAPTRSTAATRGRGLGAAVLSGAVLAAAVLLLPLASSSAQSFPVVRSAPAAGGEWSWPVAGPRRLERAFDPPAHEYGAGHRGIDIGAAPGAPISSPADGIVLFAGPVAGRSVVTVDHGGGVVSSFDPVIPSVVTGTIVTRDTVIGHLEAGRSMHCVDGCLHLGARLGGVYIDPLPLFGRPVRSVLLPVGG